MKLPTARVFLAPLALAGALATPPRAEAQVQYFGEDVASFGQSNDRLDAFPNATTQRDLFFAALSSDVGIESFEGRSGTISSLAFTGAGTATLTGNGYVESTSNTTRSNLGLYGSDGLSYYRIDTNQAFTILFSDPTAAFGFFATDVGDYGGQLFLTFLRGSDEQTVAVPHSHGVGGSTNASVFFYGLIDTAHPLDGVRFTSQIGGTSETFAFDEMTIASPAQVIDPPTTTTPEPVSLALVGTGLAGLALARRRRRAVG